jgi:5-methylcytosine-specific restriction protein A
MGGRGGVDSSDCVRPLDLEPALKRPWQHLYNSRWNRASKAFRDRYSLCTYCQQVGKTTRATVTDHIVPHKGGVEKFWDQSNWQPLCKHCHDSVKAAEEARGYAVGCDADGLPIDPGHDWNKGD